MIIYIKWNHRKYIYESSSVHSSNEKSINKKTIESFASTDMETSDYCLQHYFQQKVWYAYNGIHRIKHGKLIK